MMEDTWGTEIGPPAEPRWPHWPHFEQLGITPDFLRIGASAMRGLIDAGYMRPSAHSQPRHTDQLTIRLRRGK